jgi:hypothetical protein
VAESRPVLLVGADTAARGVMESVNMSRGLLGVALVLAPAAGPRSAWRLDGQLGTGLPSALPAGRAAGVLAGNAMADALPLFAALAAGAAAGLGLHVGGNCVLDLRVSPLAGPGAEFRAAARGGDLKPR